jgi:hypothetical protein
MKKLALAFSFLLSLYTCAQVYGNDGTGNSLSEAFKAYGQWEKNGELSKDGAAKIGYIQGLVRGVSSTGDKKLWSLPNDSDLTQYCAVVRKYLSEHPEKWSEHDWFLVAMAMKQAFPISSTESQVGKK